MMMRAATVTTTMEEAAVDNGKDKAMCHPFRTTPSGILWFKCLIYLREDYDFEAKVVLHVLEVIKQDEGMLDVVECHR
jgi:hypothetical protein